MWRKSEQMSVVMEALKNSNAEVCSKATVFKSSETASAEHRHDSVYARVRPLLGKLSTGYYF